jgi:hypothetical protein
VLDQHNGQFSDAHQHEPDADLLMKTLILIAALFCSAPAFGVVCTPADVSGCPTTIPGTPGSTTPAAITGTTWTANGVTDSVDVINQAEYNHPVCPGTNTTGGGGCTLTVFMPHACNGVACADHEIIYVLHGGGGSQGNATNSDGFANAGTGCCQTSILKVQQLLGSPNAVGGRGSIVVQLNYRLTDAGVGDGVNVFPAQWQDAKCGLWHMLANSSTFPGNKTLIGLYGPSWGAILVGWVAQTPDNAYTASCDSSAPGTPPTYRAVAAWTPINWLTPTGNAAFDNVNQTCAYQNAVIGQLYLGTDTAITGHCVQGTQPQSYTPSTVEATLQSHYAGFSPLPDLAGSIPTTSLAVLSNAQMLYQFGTPSNVSTAGDILVMPYWNTKGITTLTTGGAAGGNLWALADAYKSTGVHPFMQILAASPGAFSCGGVATGGVCHEGDTTQTLPVVSPSQIDAFNFLLGTAQPLGNAGMGGNL